MKRILGCLLVVVFFSISLTIFAVTDDINRIAEQADNLYVQQRYSEAFPLMKRAAEGGDVISMFTLGTMYYEGQGTAKSISEARRWWQAAANQGDDLAREMLNRLDAKQGASKPRTQTFTVRGISFTMVCVDGGTFTMGATKEQGDDADYWEKPAHQVTLSNFSIGQTEVTQALWQAVMGSNPSYFKSNLLCPVECVSWNDCQRFIKKLNKLTGHTFRLPTEAEWEYAARGGNCSKGYKYAGSNALDDVAWYSGNSISTTHVIATRAPNELGLYDMSGNVLEWCHDRYGGDYSDTAHINPTGPNSGSWRVNRGGSWDFNAKDCRVSNRSGGDPNGILSALGLRLAL